MNTKIKTSLGTMGTRLTTGAKHGFGALKAKIGRSQPNRPNIPPPPLTAPPPLPAQALQPQTELLAELRSRLRERPGTDHIQETPAIPARLVAEEQTEHPLQPEGNPRNPRPSNIFYRLANAFRDGVTSKSALKARGEADVATLRADNAKCQARRVAELNAALPEGIPVTADGRIHGEIDATSHSRTVNGKPTMVDNQAYCASLIDRNLARLASYATNGGIDEQTNSNAEDKLFAFKAADGLRYIIHMPAHKDMGRLENVTIIRDGQTILTREDLVEATKDNQPGEDKVEARSMLVIARLASLCDKDEQGNLTEAGQRQLVALSTLYCQGTVGRALLAYQTKETGESVILMAPSDANCVKQDGIRMTRYFDEHGQSQLKPLTSTLAATITVTRQGDTFLFETDLECDIRQINMQDLPHMQGHTIALTAKTRIILDLKELEDGRNGLTYEPIAITVKGHMPAP
jgi:hypothetical protein